MKALVLLIAALLGTTASAQYWRALGQGVVGPASVQTLYGDSVSDRLLAGGTFMWILNEQDTVLGMGQAAWNGSRWDSLATRIQPINGNNSAEQTYWFLRYEGHLYACGAFAFQTPGGNSNFNLARLDEDNQQWENLGCNIPHLSGIKTLVPKEPQSTLYATGYLGSADEFCGMAPANVFTYDGTAFHPWPPMELIPDNPTNYVGTIFDYKGYTYVTCSLRDPLGPGYVTFLRWNGTAWEHVPGWNTLSPIKDILIRDDILYVAGTFTQDDGGPGNLVAAFNGEEWNDMGGGLYYTWAPMSGSALDLEWFQGELWVCGYFNWAAGIAARSIAKWNGRQWCIPPGDFRWAYYSQSKLHQMAVWRDSLYVCGGILSVDWVPMKHVVQWLGGDEMEACSDSVGTGVPGHQMPQRISVASLPGEGRWELRFPQTGPWIVDVIDASGREVHRLQVQADAMDLDLSWAAGGMYIVHATHVDGTNCHVKLVKP